MLTVLKSLDFLFIVFSSFICALVIYQHTHFADLVSDESRSLDNLELTMSKPFAHAVDAEEYSEQFDVCFYFFKYIYFLQNLERLIDNANRIDRITECIDEMKRANVQVPSELESQIDRLRNKSEPLIPMVYFSFKIYNKYSSFDRHKRNCNS